MASKSQCNECQGPGYATPIEAMATAPREKLVYLPCIQIKAGKRDYLATVNIDPSSTEYCKVIHRLPMLHDNDELHHSGWNTCASCYGNPAAKRDKLILPCIGSSRIYIIDVSTPRSPRIHAVIEPSEMKALGVTRPHTAHCMADGDVLISTMADENDQNKGAFVLVSGKTWKLKGLWSNQTVKHNYDFWYQYKDNTLISSEWGNPSCWWKGFDNSRVREDYGHELHIWDFKTHQYKYSIPLGDEGRIPLETRFLHDPSKSEGFVGCAYSSNVFRFFKDPLGVWQAEKVIDIPAKSVEGWALPYMPGLITDILISMDDRFLYFSNWIQGDLRQYDISDTRNPKLVGRLFLGGSITSDSGVKTVNDLEPQPAPVYVKGRKLHGGPQMIQLSLDGKRLYLTDSLLSGWDRQFYPNMVKNGSVMLQVDVDTEKGGLTLNKNFLVDFGKEPGGPVLAHEIRYPGGDCTSDIYLPPLLIGYRPH
ncbi:hypothetical protein EB796_007065 [Bugula neritina]|uniref:SELENBP1 n=1 Tax=Bugula neritina TaxID=10212 RepID=A0A7J7K8T5_BUGNE|nr:hypothetical protein EB796_007065 [Bugula neritina]